MAAAVIVERLTGQQGNILTAGTERRQGDIGDVEAVEEIFPKAPLLHRLDQILMAGAEHPHLRRALTILLHHLQQLGLQGFGEAANLVEKQGRPLGLLEQPGLAIFAKQLQVE